MSTKAYKEKSREWVNFEVPPCLGRCGNDFEAAYASVTNDHPDWSKARRAHRARVEMFKRDGGQQPCA